MEIGWLIERQVGDRAVWWRGGLCPRDWTTDANEAVRFARQVDGERALASLHDWWADASVTEHGWCPVISEPPVRY